MLISNLESTLEALGALRLQRPQSEVTIFVDPETESKPTTDNVDSDGHSNVLLAKLFLNRLGTINNVLKILGLLSTTCIYLTNIPGSTYAESQYSSNGLP